MMRALSTLIQTPLWLIKSLASLSHQITQNPKKLFLHFLLISAYVQKCGATSHESAENNNTIVSHSLPPGYLPPPFLNATHSPPAKIARLLSPLRDKSLIDQLAITGPFCYEELIKILKNQYTGYLFRIPSQKSLSKYYEYYLIEGKGNDYSSALNYLKTLCKTGRIPPGTGNDPEKQAAVVCDFEATIEQLMLQDVPQRDAQGRLMSRLQFGKVKVYVTLLNGFVCDPAGIPETDTMSNEDSSDDAYQTRFVN